MGYAVVLGEALVDLQEQTIDGELVVRKSVTVGRHSSFAKSRQSSSCC